MRASHLFHAWLCAAETRLVRSLNKLVASVVSFMIVTWNHLLLVFNVAWEVGECSTFPIGGSLLVI